MDRFQYHVLEGRRFRLLRILPGSPLETLQCELISASLEACPSYTALSYAWGSTAESCVVRVNGQQLRVRENLWNYLHQIRSPVDNEPGTYYWIDAISINQDDIQERGHQVNMMRDIFSKATSVDVWLGSADESTPTAFARFLDGQGQFGGKWNLYSHRGYYDFRFFRSELEWEALTALFSRPYWERVWIVQEYVLAIRITLRCGKYSAESKSLDALSSAFSRHRVTWLHDASTKFTQSPGWTVHQQRIARLKELAAGTDLSTSRFTLRRLLVAHHSAQCTELLDRIFAFLGLCVDNDPHEHAIVADYTKSKIELLAEIIRHCCTWNSRQSVLLNSKFIRLMKGSLELTEADDGFTRYVIEECPGLQKWLHIVVGPRYLYTTLRCFGQIGEVGRYEHALSSRTGAAANQSLGAHLSSCIVSDLSSKSNNLIFLNSEFESLGSGQTLPIPEDFEDLYSFLKRVPRESLPQASHSDAVQFTEWPCLMADNGEYIAHSSSAFQEGDWVCAPAQTSRSALVVRDLEIEDKHISKHKVVGLCTLHSSSNHISAMANKEKMICLFFPTVDLTAFVETDLLSPEKVPQTEGLQLRKWTTPLGSVRGGLLGDDRPNGTKREQTPPPSASKWLPPDFVETPGFGGPGLIGGGSGFHGHTS